MEIPWTGDRCILCLREGRLRKEHLIPQALGGRLWSKFLCFSCNSRFGGILEANAKSDPSILLAAQNLEGVIPTLAKSIIEGHPQIGHSQSGPAPGFFRNDH